MATTRTDDSALAAISYVGNDEKSSREDESIDRKDINEDDDAHAGLVFPTEEEQATLRRVADSLPWSAYSMSLLKLLHGANRFTLTTPSSSDRPDRAGRKVLGEFERHPFFSILGALIRPSSTMVLLLSL